MDIKFVSRDQIDITRRRSSKFKPLLEALDELEVDGKAVEVAYKSEKNVNSMRAAVYKYNKRKNVKIRSEKDPNENKVYFYRVE